MWVAVFGLVLFLVHCPNLIVRERCNLATSRAHEGAAEGRPSVRANAYDLVINGVEVGGGSIRIFDKDLQAKMFALLGFSKEDAESQFGFLMNAFKYGAPPHGGIAFGFDRLCSLFGGADSIRDFIAFPKNNAGRDVMIDSPSVISDEQLKELSILVKKN